MLKRELADAAGVSLKTLHRWCQPYRKELREMGVKRNGAAHTAERLRSMHGAGAQYPAEPTRGSREPTPSNPHKDCPCFDAAREYKDLQPK